MSDDFGSGGRQMTGCAGYTLGKGGPIKLKWGEGERDGTLCYAFGVTGILPGSFGITR